jgi:hypothetical protein
VEAKLNAHAGSAALSSFRKTIDEDQPLFPQCLRTPVQFVLSLIAGIVEYRLQEAFYRSARL